MDTTIGSLFNSFIRTIWLVPTMVDYFVLSAVLIIFVFTVNYKMALVIRPRHVLLMILIVFFINITQSIFGYHPSGIISLVVYLLLVYLLRTSQSFL